MNKYSNKELIKKICFDNFGENNIIVVHYCGSLAYGTSDNNSDADVIVITKSKIKINNVLRSDNSYQYCCVEGIDFFIIDYDNAIKMHKLDESTNLYMRVFSDSVLLLNDNLIYKNENYLEEFNKYSNFNVNDILIQYYGNILEYYRKLFYVRYPNTIKKREHHLFRFLDNFNYFLQNGNYNPIAFSENFSNLLVFKQAAKEGKVEYRALFENALKQLEKKVFDYYIEFTKMDTSLKNIRKNLIKKENGVTYFKMSKIGDSKQKEDLSVPSNCLGFGRIHHFKKQVDLNWIEDNLPAYPAFYALNLPYQDRINAQVFQISKCNLNCWYCFVPEELRSGSNKNSAWFTADELINLYNDEKEKSLVIDLSGGNPELVPEWTIEMMHSLLEKGISKSVYLWSDDSLTTNAFYKYLSDENIQFLINYKNYGKVCCFKGFDYDSFSFNTSLPKYAFYMQKELFRKYYSLGIDLYGYITLTTDNVDNIDIKIKNFIDYLQSIHKNLPLRVVPLKILVFKAMEHRLTIEKKRALINQEIVLKAWKNELNKRFNEEELKEKICCVKIY